MTTDELLHTLNQLLSLPAENEVVEFKEAKTSFDLDALGEYFSAAFDDDHYKKMILEYLKKFSKAPRKKLEKLILDKLPDVLSNDQKKNKVKNLLASLRVSGQIRNTGYGEWELVK